MSKDELVKQMLIAESERSSTVDINAYGMGLIDMYDKLVNLYNLPVVSGSFSATNVEQSYKDGVRDALAKGYGTFDIVNYR